MTNRFLFALFGSLAALAASGQSAPKPQVLLETSKGNVVLELDPEKAPASVENFLAYVESGFYNRTIFHRVIPGFMVQGGGFDESMSKLGTRPPIVNESRNGLKNERGSIAMARTSDPNSATAQFFVNLVDNTFLDYPNNGGYAVFGRVIEGMETFDGIAAVPTGRRGPMSDVPKETVKILSATVRKAPAAAPEGE